MSEKKKCYNDQCEQFTFNDTDFQVQNHCKHYNNINDCIFFNSDDIEPEPEPEPTQDSEKQEGTKFDEGKPRPYLVLGNFNNAIQEIVLNGTKGAKVHGDCNWKLVRADKYKEALLRHWLAYIGGENIDPTDNIPHISKVAWNAMAIRELDILEEKANET